MSIQNEIKISFGKLKTYCENEGFKGWDPYDGLNSTIFQKLPFKKISLARLAWIQFFKKSPLNFRNLLLVKKDYNAKGLGLFLTGYCNLYKIEPKEEYLTQIKFLSNKILSLQTQGYSGSCWGYNFDWQARAFFQPKHTPTVVATTFIAYALLDAYEITGDKKLLDTARSACNFVLNDLNKTLDKEGGFAFSYSPIDKTQVFNASLLGTRLLARVYSYTKEKILIENARKSVVFCVNYQKSDGSWAYSPLPFHQWIDNFHTGYNLECIFEYQKYSGDTSFNTSLEKGMHYYLNTFFEKDGTPRYYNNSVYPIDIHAPAQLVVTLYRMNQLNSNIDLVNKVLSWTLKNMQTNEGYFIYQINKYYSSTIPYIRWAQSWMFFSLSFYLLHVNSHTQINADKEYKTSVI